MSRPIVGTNLQTGDDTAPGSVTGMEFRTAEGSYWRLESDGLCHMLNGGCTPWNLGRVLRAAPGPAIVTYVPPVPSPHTKPGIYVCSEMCQYLFERMDQDLWQGPWRPNGTVVRKAGPMMTWEELEEEYGDCSRNLVGPVPPVFLKGH